MYQTALLRKKLWSGPVFVTSHLIAMCDLETFSTGFTEPVRYAVPFCVRHFCLVPA